MHFQPITKEHPKVVQTAKLTKLTPEEVIKRLEKVYDGKTDASQVTNHSETRQLKKAASSNEIKLPININLGIIALKGYILFRPGNDWVLDIDLTLYLFGVGVLPIKFRLDERNPEICLNPNLGIVSAKLCLGLRGTRKCFYVKGNVCSIGGCTHFDETVHCFG